MQVRDDSGGRGALANFLGEFAKSEEFVGVAHSAEHEVHSAEVKVCLSARKAPIVLPLSHKRL